MKPRADFIIVQPEKFNNLTESGIHLLSDPSKKGYLTGIVIAIGDEVQDVVVGEKIVFAQYAPTEIKIDGEIVLLIKEEDIYGTL